MIKIHLSKLLGEKRINQVTLSRMTGIRPATVNELYHEISERISIEHIDKICEALNCSVGELIEYLPDEVKSTNEYLIIEEHGNRKKNNKAK